MAEILTGDALRTQIQQRFSFFTPEMVEYEARRREIPSQLRAQYEWQGVGPVINLTEHRGFAGLLILDERGPLYVWEWGGITLSGASMPGFFVPFERDLVRALLKIGPDTHLPRPEGKAPRFDWGKFRPLLEQHLPGWEPAYDLEPACDEAYVLVRCTRDLTEPQIDPELDLLEAAELINDDFYTGELARSPFANRIESFQGRLVGKLGVIIWENSD